MSAFRIFKIVFLCMLCSKALALEFSSTLYTIVLDSSEVITLTNLGNLKPLESPDVHTELLSDSSIKIHAPKSPGFYTLTLHGSNAERSLNLIVKRPFNAKNNQVNNYQIGLYKGPYKGLAQYIAPAGLIEVDKHDMSLKLTPHVKVSNLICKQASGYPKYFYVNTKSLQMLEDLLAFVKTRGIDASQFAFISAYRTPYYHRAIGSSAHSRHQYGDAFDLYVDEDGDGRMDDLNHDGKLTLADVDVLYRAFIEFQEQTDYKGGVGRYKPTSNHGGFVHIDNRGIRARW